MSNNNPFTKKIFYLTKQAIGLKDGDGPVKPTQVSPHEQLSGTNVFEGIESESLLKQFLKELGIAKTADKEESSVTNKTEEKTEQEQKLASLVEDKAKPGLRNLLDKVRNLEPHQLTDDFLIDTAYPDEPFRGIGIRKNLTQRTTPPLLIESLPTTTTTASFENSTYFLKTLSNRPYGTPLYGVADTDIDGRRTLRPNNQVQQINPILVESISQPTSLPINSPSPYYPYPIPISNDTDDLVLLRVNGAARNGQLNTLSTTLTRSVYETAIDYYNLNTTTAARQTGPYAVTPRLNLFASTTNTTISHYMGKEWWDAKSPPSNPFYCYGTGDVCNPVLAGSQPCSTGWCETHCPDQAYWVRGSARLLPLLIPILIALAFTAKIVIASVIFGRRKREMGTALNVYLGGHTISDILFLVCAGILQYLTWVGGGSSSSKIKPVRSNPAATIAIATVSPRYGDNRLGLGRTLWNNFTSRFSRIDSYFFALSEAFWLISIYILMAAVIDRCLRWKRRNAGDQKLSIRRCGTWGAILTVIGIYLFGLATSLPRIWMAHERHAWFYFPNKAVEGSRFYCRMYDWSVMLISTILPLIGLLLLSSFLSHIICRDRRRVKARAKELKDLETSLPLTGSCVPAIVGLSDEVRRNSIGVRHPYILDTDERLPAATPAGYNVVGGAGRVYQDAAQFNATTTNVGGIGSVVTPLRRPPAPPPAIEESHFLVQQPTTHLPNDVKIVETNNENNNNNNNTRAFNSSSFPEPLPPYYTYNINNNNNNVVLQSNNCCNRSNPPPRSWYKKQGEPQCVDDREYINVMSGTAYYYGKTFNSNNNNNQNLRDESSMMNKYGYEPNRYDYSDTDGEDDLDSSIYTNRDHRSDYYDVSAEERGILMNRQAHADGSALHRPEGITTITDLRNKRKSMLKRFWSRTRATYLLTNLSFLTPLLVMPFAISQIWIHRIQTDGPSVGSIVLSQIFQCFIYLNCILHLPLLILFYDRFRRGFYYTCCPCCAYNSRANRTAHGPDVGIYTGLAQKIDDNSNLNKNKMVVRNESDRIGILAESEERYATGPNERLTMEQGTGHSRLDTVGTYDNSNIITSTNKNAFEEETRISSPETEKLLVHDEDKGSNQQEHKSKRGDWFTNIFLPKKSGDLKQNNKNVKKDKNARQGIQELQEGEDFGNSTRVWKLNKRGPIPEMTTSMLSSAASDARTPKFESKNEDLFNAGTYNKKVKGKTTISDTIVVMGTSPSTGPFSSTGKPPLITVRVVGENCTLPSRMESSMIESCYVIPSSRSTSSPPSTILINKLEMADTTDNTSTFRKGIVNKQVKVNKSSFDYDPKYTGIVDSFREARRQGQELIGVGQGQVFDTPKHEKGRDVVGLRDDVKVLTTQNGNDSKKGKKIRKRSHVSDGEQKHAKGSAAAGVERTNELPSKKRSSSQKLSSIFSSHKSKKTNLAETLDKLEPNDEYNNTDHIEKKGTGDVDEEQSLSHVYGPEGEDQLIEQISRSPPPSPPLPSHYQSPLEGWKENHQLNYDSSLYKDLTIKKITPLSILSPSGRIRNIDNINRTHYGYNTEKGVENGVGSENDTVEEIRDYIDGGSNENGRIHSFDESASRNVKPIGDLDHDPYRYGSVTPLNGIRYDSSNNAINTHQMGPPSTSIPSPKGGSKLSNHHQSFHYYQPMDSNTTTNQDERSLGMTSISSKIDGDKFGSENLRSSAGYAYSSFKSDPDRRKITKPSRPTYEQVFGLERDTAGLERGEQGGNQTFQTFLGSSGPTKNESLISNYSYSSPFYTQNRYYTRYAPDSYPTTATTIPSTRNFSKESHVKINSPNNYELLCKNGEIQDQISQNGTREHESGINGYNNVETNGTNGVDKNNITQQELIKPYVGGNKSGSKMKYENITFSSHSKVMGFNTSTYTYIEK